MCTFFELLNQKNYLDTWFCYQMFKSMLNYFNEFFKHTEVKLKTILIL